MKNHLMISGLLEKLIGASFSISIFFIIMFIGSGFNLFEFHNTVTVPALWMIFFGYGMISSLVIDVIGKFIPTFSFGKQLLLYLLFGYLIFVVFMPIEFALLAGTVGAFFSFLFLLGKEILKPARWYSWLVFVVPLACLAIMPFDHTSKVGWHEVADDSSVEVTYDYFYGEHLIPIHGSHGEKIYFVVDHQISDGYGYGVSVYNEDGDYAGMNDESGDVISVEFEEESIKYIAVSVTGGRQSGFQVKWWNEE
ncbi:hypothetical protein JSQ81_11525 [Sporosarcina sp. Marseille-Q4063]|uniref:hypothetical protein n=1 Tax=Sporosarcina sp. Marseille-Q4063 TaxID=2810514 RepID=UPI001BB051E3|nr:hypothetical protein [Sporosarcina sp. Marseille-Q4063]QUW20491.1 hypothetical protein JSQ81_11525 [Sporosarcina sp. Marseille-Q4063]